jgi:hypothetical protein
VGGIGRGENNFQLEAIGRIGFTRGTEHVVKQGIFFNFEEMLGWHQKVLWCSHIFLHSFVFWIENALHPFI